MLRCFFGVADACVEGVLWLMLLRWIVCSTRAGICGQSAACWITVRILELGMSVSVPRACFVIDSFVVINWKLFVVSIRVIVFEVFGRWRGDLRFAALVLRL